MLKNALDFGGNKGLLFTDDLSSIKSAADESAIIKAFGNVHKILVDMDKGSLSSRIASTEKRLQKLSEKLKSTEEVSEAQTPKNQQQLTSAKANLQTNAASSAANAQKAPPKKQKITRNSA